MYEFFRVGTPSESESELSNHMQINLHTFSVSIYTHNMGLSLIIWNDIDTNEGVMVLFQLL